MHWPDTVGGPLFVKGGAIIPMAQVTRYSDEEPLEVVVLDAYPCGDSQYTLYEDDGVSYEYEKGGLRHHRMCTAARVTEPW